MLLLRNGVSIAEWITSTPQLTDGEHGPSDIEAKRPSHTPLDIMRQGSHANAPSNSTYQMMNNMTT